MEIVTLRRRELIAIWALFALWAFSQYMYRYAHQEPYNLKVAWDYLLGFLLYMVAPWAVTFFLALCGYVVGRVTIRLVARGLEFRSDLEESVYSISIGLGIIATVTFLLGLAGLLYPLIFGLLALVVPAAGFRHVAHLFRALRRGLAPLNWDLLDAALFLLVGLFVIITFLSSCNPSTGFDAINSHLCAPKYYLRDNAVTFFPWINFNNFPQIQEMLLTLEMMVFEDPGSSIIYFYTLGIAALTYLIGARFFGRRVGLIGVLLLLFIEKIQYLAQGAMVENLLGFYVLLLLHAFLAWYHSRDSRWLVLLGMAGGLACGTKYTGMVSVLMILVLMVLARFLPIPRREHDLMAIEAEVPTEETTVGKAKSKRSRKADIMETRPVPAEKEVVPPAPETVPAPPRAVGALKATGIVLLWTVIIAAPWYIRSIVLFGNPFFPFYESIFGGLGVGTLDSIRDQLAVDHAEMLKYFGFQPTLYNLLALPWNFTFHNKGPWLWHDIPGPVGPFLLAFTPAAIFIRRWHRIGIMIVIYLVIYYSYWLLFERMEDHRYMTSAYPLHCLIVAWGLYELFRLKAFDPRNRTHLAWLFLSIALGFAFFYRTTAPEYTGASLAFLKETRETHMRRKVPGYRIVQRINESIDSGSRYFNEDTVIYGLGTEDRRYYLDCPLIGGIFGLANHFEFMEHASTGQELYDYLDGLGCEYVLFDKIRTFRMAYLLTVQLPEDETFGQRFSEIDRVGDVHLYQMLAPGESPVPSME